MPLEKVVSNGKEEAEREERKKQTPWPLLFISLTVPGGVEAFQEEENNIGGAESIEDEVDIAAGGVDEEIHRQTGILHGVHGCGGERTKDCADQVDKEENPKEFYRSSLDVFLRKEWMKRFPDEEEHPS